MPGMDGTGPRGGIGMRMMCTGFGRACGIGRGLGWRTGICRFTGAGSERGELEASKRMLQARIDEIDRRLNILGKE